MTQYGRSGFGAIPLTGVATGTYTVKVNAQAYMCVAGSLKIDLNVGRRSQLSCTLKTSTTTQFRQYQPITVFDEAGNLVFSGWLSQPKAIKPGFSKTLSWSITATDHHLLADKRIIAKTYKQMTCGQIVEDIQANYLAAEGVTLGAVSDGLYPGPTLYPSPTLYPNGNVGSIPVVTFSYCTVAAALDELVKKASSAGIPYYWTIDAYKQLWFVPYTYLESPTVINGTFIENAQNIATIQRQNPKYRNTEWIAGGLAQTVTQIEKRLGDGNTTAWNMGYELYSEPIVQVNGVRQTVGIKGTTGAAFYWAQGDRAIVQDSNATPLSNAQILQIIYIGQYPEMTSQKTDAQIAFMKKLMPGTSGIFEVVDEDKSLVDVPSAQLEAGRLLTLYGQEGTQLTFTTKMQNFPPFQPGQLLTVDLPDFGLAQTQMLIETVSIADNDGLNIWYTITAVSGPYDTTWVSFFSQLLASSQPASNVTAGISGAPIPASYDGACRFLTYNGGPAPHHKQRDGATRFILLPGGGVTHISQTFQYGLVMPTVSMSATVTTGGGGGGGGGNNYPVISVPSSGCSSSIQSYTTKNTQPIRFIVFKDNDNTGVGNDIAQVYGGNILLYWADIEKSQGQRNWSIVENCIKQWSDHGKKAIVRISTCGQSGWTSKWSCGQGTPQWVLDKGVKSYKAGSNGNKGVVPQYWNSTFEQYFDAFVQDFAAHYDGDPRIEFIQAAVGMGGESKPDTTAKAGDSTLTSNLNSIGFDNDKWWNFITHVADLYHGHFTKSKLCFIPGAFFDTKDFGGSKHSTADVVNYVKGNFGLQNDGIGSGSSFTAPDPNWGSAKFISAEQRDPTNQTGDNFECDVQAIISYCQYSPTIYALCFIDDLRNNSSVLQKYGSVN